MIAQKPREADLVRSAFRYLDFANFPQIIRFSYDLLARPVVNRQAIVTAHTFTKQETYPFRELCRQVLSPGAVGVLEQLEREILDIYGLEMLLDTELLQGQRTEHAEFIMARIKRLSQMLPPDISRTPNEIFTAIEFIVYEILDRPINIGEAWMRLELLADEFRARPLVHDLVIGIAN